MSILIVFAGGPSHYHCEFCGTCLKDDIFIPFECRQFFIEFAPGKPDEYEAGTWRACVECAALIENKEATKLVDRFVELNGESAAAARSNAVKIVDSFFLFRIKKEFADG